MKLTVQDVEYTAKLAVLDFSEEEKESLRLDLEAILDYADELNKAEIEGIEPLTHVMEEVNVLRADEEGETLPIDEALQNAPASDGRYFKVPKVL